jgi:hypothetical protein
VIINSPLKYELKNLKLAERIENQTKVFEGNFFRVLNWVKHKHNFIQHNKIFYRRCVINTKRLWKLFWTPNWIRRIPKDLTHKVRKVKTIKDARKLMKY